MSALIVVSTPGQQFVALLEIAATFVAAYLAGKTLWWFLWGALERFEQSRRAGAVNAAQGVAPEDEPSWPGKAPHTPSDPISGAIVLSGVVPVVPADTRIARHAATEVDAIEPVVDEQEDGEPAGAVVGDGR